MRCTLLICISIIIFLFSPTFATESQLAEKTILSVRQSLEYHIQRCEDVKIRVYIPQEDEFQKIISLNASSPFRKVSDRYGNFLLEFSPRDEKGKITITTLLSVSRRRVEINSKDFEKLARTAKNVYEMLEYSEDFADVILSPEEILKKKKGTCDEFSTLMIYFLRENGINASYEVGYAYQSFAFQPHGWVRVKLNGKTLDFDPTWCEFPVDAFHVKLASLPSAFFNETEARGKCYQNGKILIAPQQVEIQILNVTYFPLVQGNFTFLEEKAKYDFYTLAKVELFSKGCILTTLNFGKCVDEKERPILEPYIFPKCVYFCGKKRVFAIFKANNASYEAKCRISAKPSLGDLTMGEVILEKAQGEKVWLNISKNRVNKCETVLLSSNGHIFALEDFYAFKKGYLKACENTTIYALKDSLTKSEIIVREFGQETQDTEINNTRIKQISKKEQIETTEEIREIGKKNFSFIERIIEFFKELLSFLI